ncbi:hypothetical protein [Pedobacter sp. KBS0701]|uniref:hypothetical protein n=1 Tax=Pedobacter sp. KBS0701 TaxID=2578106 RepID=UPI00143CEEAF|nr:hypothetical protein [Pedobacter sp. KBS0701]
MKLDYLPSISDDNTTIKIPRYGYRAIWSSKTADIEQTLVIAAYYARSLTIFILAEAA